MNDYDRVASVIRYLDKRHADQPDLAALAKQVNLSPHHFHRLFTSWAGITPKDFLQCLTLAHAKTLLRSGKSVLDSTLDSGLSSPSRLHDSCVTLEAASPGEVKSGGEGWTITIGFADSPFGRCLLGESPRGICHISFIESKREDAALAEVQNQWPRARLHRDDAAAHQLADGIFRRKTIQNSLMPLSIVPSAKGAEQTRIAFRLLPDDVHDFLPDAVRQVEGGPDFFRNRFAIAVDVGHLQIVDGSANHCSKRFARETGRKLEFVLNSGNDLRLAGP